MPRPDLEELAGRRFLEAYGERLPVDEHATTRALTPLLRPTSFDNEDNVRMRDAITMLRTSSYFVVDLADMDPIKDMAIDSITEEDEIIVGLDLPPLPFPRIWIECCKGEAAVTAFRMTDLDGVEYNIMGWAISEIDPGNDWNVFCFMHPIVEEPDSRNADGLPVYTWSKETVSIRQLGIFPTGVGIDGKSDNTIQFDTEDNTSWFTMMVLMPLGLAQFLTTQGVKHVKDPIPRPVRRRFARRFTFDHPQVYWVDASGAGESNPHSQRQYRHRWIVKGHWRLSEAGTHFIKHKGGMCTWIRPYVKGPKGAPWKGRPIHV
ncbi:MAG TPA: hypothetical protein VH593_19990 [Ktedonobacteraceae bacterium]|jgi:hypothetical protein